MIKDMCVCVFVKIRWMDGGKDDVCACVCTVRVMVVCGRGRWR